MQFILRSRVRITEGTLFASDAMRDHQSEDDLEESRGKLADPHSLY
jgi:hypothetical protein